DGLGAAYRAGFDWGLERGYEVFVEMDADLSHPADRLPALLDALGDADLVIGSRYVAGGATANWPWYRQLISRSGNAYVSTVLGLPVRDATAGFRAFRRELLEGIGVSDLTSNGYCFQVETTYQATRAGYRLREVPITFTERVAGRSKMSSAIVAEALMRVTGWGLRDRLTERRVRPRRVPRPWTHRSAAVVAGFVLAGVLGGGVALALGGGESPDPPRPSTPVTVPLPTTSALTPETTPTPTTPVSTTPTSTTPGTVADPVSVAVPRIGVDTPLVRLGIAADGSLEVPGRGEFDRAGWLASGPAPGARGPAVIAGHVDSTTGPAVFYRLRELRPGDEVDITRADASTAVFVVDDVQQVGKDEFPTTAVYGPRPGPVLRLITCGGEFDHATGHYEDNVIAFASLRG
ncbi:MAG: class F sortase, partial [Janthinobacterium lividum]